MGYFGSFYGGAIGSILDYLANIGFFEYVLPFLLYFALFYGLFSKANLFTKGDNSLDKVNAILALSMSLLLLYYVPGSRTIGMFLSELFSRWGALAVVLLLIPLTLAIFGIKIVDLFDLSNKDARNVALGVAALMIIFLLILIYPILNAYGLSFNVYVDPTYFGIAILILVLGGIIYAVSDDGSGSSSSKGGGKGI